MEGDESEAVAEGGEIGRECEVYGRIVGVRGGSEKGVKERRQMGKVSAAGGADENTDLAESKEVGKEGSPGRRERGWERRV
jgi:hypothetical protein